jgi:arginase family protein
MYLIIVVFLSYNMVHRLLGVHSGQPLFSY